MHRFRRSPHRAQELAASHRSDTCLHGCLLVQAWVAWALLSSTTLLAFAFSLPAYVTLLKTVCTGPICIHGQITSETEATLHRLGLPPDSYVTLMLTLTLVSLLLACAISGLFAWRRSRDWLALLVALMLLMFGTDDIVSTTALYTSAGHFFVAFFDTLHFATVFLVGVLMPSGRFVPHWTRWLVPAWILWRLILLVFPALPSADLLNTVVWLSALACIGAAMLYRYRWMSSPGQRQQIKWLVFGGSTTILIVLICNLPPLIFPALNRPGSLYILLQSIVNKLSFLPIIFSFAFAILRSRLWEIDVLINRALVYGALTATLALVYLCLVIVLSSFLQDLTSQTSSIAIVLSTLAVAALFQPLRFRLQQLIDRYCYRHKYNAARTLTAFSSTLRHEVDLDQLSATLLDIVHETMQPAHVSLWVRPTSPDKQDDGAPSIRTNMIG